MWSVRVINKYLLFVVCVCVMEAFVVCCLLFMLLVFKLSGVKLGEPLLYLCVLRTYTG